MPGRRKSTAKTQGVKPARDVSAAMRAAEALDLAIAGHDWQAVASMAGYASRGAAYNAVMRELDRILTPKAEQLRKIHLRRYAKLRSVYYPKAMAGDGWSFDRVLRLDEREAQLMGLNKPAEAEAQAGAQVVVRAYPPEWINSLPAAGLPAPATPPAESEASA